MKPDIFPIQMGLDTVYVVRGDGTILIDGGDPGNLSKFKKGIEKCAVKPEEIRLIVLTHGHWDHIGSVKDVRDLTGAQVLLHQRDQHFLEEARPSQPPGLTLWGKVVISLIGLYCLSVRIPKFDVDILAGDEEISLVDFGIPGKVVSTPGHSWGSVSVLLDSGEAFVGDLVMNMIPLRVKPGLPIFGDDIQIVKNSLRKLAMMGAKTIYPAHGKLFPMEALQASIR